MKTRKLIVLYILCVAVIIGFVRATQNTDGYGAMIIPRPSLQGVISGQSVGNYTAEINGQTVKYDAASYERCDEFYKYYHCIGYGKIKGYNESVYLYKCIDNKSTSERKPAKSETYNNR